MSRVPLPLQVSVDLWVVVGTTNVPFVNGWSNYENGYGGLRFSKDALHRVLMEGLIQGSGASTIFTLPLGYRPRYKQIFIIHTATGVGRVDIHSNGTVEFVSGSATWASLSGITFIGH